MMRYFFPLTLAFLILFASFWAGIWWWSSIRVEEQFLRWQARQAAEGRDFTFADMSVGGFPTHLRLNLTQPSMVDASGWQWSGPDLTAEAALWQPRRVSLEFPGTHVFEPPERSLLAPLELAAGVAEGDVWFDRRGLVDGMRLTFQRLALAGYFNGGTSAQALDVAWGRAIAEDQANGASRGVGDVPFFLAIDELELPSAAEPPLGRSLQELSAEGTIEGWLELGPPEEVIPAWAERGGQAQVEELRMTWGPLRLEGDASLTLDQERRPLGAGHARVQGFEAAVQAFTEAGLVEQDIGSMARMALLAMSQDSSDGQREIEVPITAQDGVLRVGPLPLLPLPPLF